MRKNNAFRLKQKTRTLACSRFEAVRKNLLSSAVNRREVFGVAVGNKPYRDKVLFPFFDGLIPEGWLLDIAEKNWKIDARDRMSLLIACCKGCIGAVGVEPISVTTQH